MLVDIQLVAEDMEDVEEPEEEIKLLTHYFY